MSYHDDVGEFHLKFGLPHSRDGSPVRLLDADTFEFRRKFLEEELAELVEAQGEGDLSGVADALADLVYVALGTAHLMGAPFDEIWREVQRANLSKDRASGAVDPRSTRGHQLDVVKPIGFEPPNHSKALARAGEKHPTEWRWRVPAGVAPCRCAGLVTDADGAYWCCGGLIGTSRP